MTHRIKEIEMGKERWERYGAYGSTNAKKRKELEEITPYGSAI